MAQANVLPRLLELYLGAGSSDDLHAKVRLGPRRKGGVARGGGEGEGDDV